MVKFFLVFLIHPFSVCQRLAIINLWEIIVAFPLGFQAQLVAVVLYIRLLLQSLVHLKGKKMFQGCCWTGDFHRVSAARVRCAACVIPLEHTVPSASSEELQVNRAAAFLRLGRWLNNFSLKNCAPLQQWLRDTHWGKTRVVSANCRDPTLRVIWGTAHLWKLCWSTETSPWLHKTLNKSPLMAGEELQWNIIKCLFCLCTFLWASVREESYKKGRLVHPGRT